MITTLSKENFEKEIKTGTVVVKFSVKNWCRYCDEFKSHYELASEAQNGIKYCEYARENLPSPNNGLDEIEQKYWVTSFPAIFLFENGEKKSDLKRYEFYSDRFLQGFIIDEQKKLFNQQCYVEDMVLHQQSRMLPKSIPVAVATAEPDFLPNVPPAPHEEWCTEWCQ
mgnify:FL=1